MTVSRELGKGAAMAVIGAVITVLVANANDNWHLLNRQAENAATKSDVADLRHELQQVSDIAYELKALRTQVQSNTEFVREGIEPRQRNIWANMIRVCERLDMVCNMTNAAYRRNAVLRMPMPSPTPDPVLIGRPVIIQSKQRGV